MYTISARVRILLTLPLEPDVWRPEVVAHLVGGDAGDEVDGLERVDRQAVHLLLALVHLHLALLGEDGPHAVIDARQRVPKLLLGDARYLKHRTGTVSHTGKTQSHGKATITRNKHRRSHSHVGQTQSRSHGTKTVTITRVIPHTGKAQPRRKGGKHNPTGQTDSHTQSHGTI